MKRLRRVTWLFYHWAALGASNQHHIIEGWLCAHNPVKMDSFDCIACCLLWETRWLVCSTHPYLLWGDKNCIGGFVRRKTQTVLHFNSSCANLVTLASTSTLMFGEVASEDCSRAAGSSSALMNWFIPPSIRPLYTCNSFQTTASAGRVYSIKQGERWQSRNDQPALLKTKSDRAGGQNRTLCCMISWNGEADWRGSVERFVFCGASNYQTSVLLQAQFLNLFFSLSLQRSRFGPLWGFKREGATLPPPSPSPTNSSAKDFCEDPGVTQHTHTHTHRQIWA